MGGDRWGAAGLPAMVEAVETLIKGLGDDVHREGLRDTPLRVAKAWLDMTAARDADPVATIGGALFAENGLNEQAGPVLVRDVDFASTCAHTLLPFYGRIHVAYLPRGGVVVGLSKVARVVQSLSKRLQTPEDLARGAAEALERAAGAAGVAVVAVFRHLARPAGLRSEVVIERTGAFAGKDPARWAEVVSMLRVGGVVLPFGSPAGEDASERSSASSDTMAVDMSATCSCHDGLGSRAGSTAALAVCCADACCLAPDVMRRAPGSGMGSDEDEDNDGPGTSPSLLREAAGEDLGSRSAAVTLADMEAAAAVLATAAGCDVAQKEGRSAVQQFVQHLLRSTRGYDEPEGPLASTSGESGRAGVRSSSWRPLPGGAWQVVGSAAVPFQSQCEHHLLPFHGRARVVLATAPGQGREVDWAGVEAAVRRASQQLQIQERLTEQVAGAVGALPGVVGCVVMVDGVHMCMVARGVERFASSTVTVAARGLYADSPALRSAAIAAMGEWSAISTRLDPPRSWAGLLRGARAT